MWANFPRQSSISSNIFILLSIIIILAVTEITQAIKVQTEISEDLAHTICTQQKKFRQLGKLQPIIKTRPPSLAGPSRVDRCGRHRWGKCGTKQGTTSCSYDTFLACDALRIVGGEDAIPHEFPSIVTFDNSGCGGTILNEYFVLTAAHCDKIRYEVVAGDHLKDEDEGTEQRVDSSVVITHPFFKQGKGAFSNDIALIKLKSPLKFNENVSAVILPTSSDYRVTGNVTAVGWGSIDPKVEFPIILQKVVLPIITDEECESFYPNDVIESQICTLLPGKDSCEGDSGGPLYQIDEVTGQQILVGITSWGKGCARPNGPGVWTEVAYFLDWIKEEMTKK